MKYSVLLCLGVQAGCFTTTVANIGQKTSLERQLIGEFEPLSEEEILAASVRSAHELRDGSLPEIQQRAIAARRRQLFNRDDLDELRTAGCLGESKEGTLAERDCEREAGLSARMIAEENADRAQIMDWALAMDERAMQGSPPPERGQLVVIYARLLRGQAKPGWWVQRDDGTWERKAK